MRRPLPSLLLVYGFILAAVSFWIVVPEVARSGVTALPSNQDLAMAAATYQTRALWAARVGMLRGDLWSELAYTYAALEWNRAALPAGSLDDAKVSADRAVSFKSVNPAVWLLIGDLAARYRWDSPNAVESLKLSYYTGPHEDRLVPLRLLIASRLDLSADPELNRLFQREIEYILLYRPSLRKAISFAYAQASAQGRLAIQKSASDIDPVFANTLPSPSGP